MQGPSQPSSGRGKKPGASLPAGEKMQQDCGTPGKSARRQEIPAAGRFMCEYYYLEE
jgi:hypothetical protein